MSTHNMFLWRNNENYPSITLICFTDLGSKTTDCILWPKEVKAHSKAIFQTFREYGYILKVFILIDANKLISKY